MPIIYHITTEETWKKALSKNTYDFCALKTEGFIHCSTFEQTIATANRFFKNQEGLIVLELDESKIKSKVLYESVPDMNEKFPHIYGELNTDSVVKVKKLTKDSSGDYNSLTD